MPSEILLLPAEGTKHKLKAYTSLKTESSIRLHFALKDLAKRHSEGTKRRSNDERPTGIRSE